jgi:hypothetical protein
MKTSASISMIFFILISVNCALAGPDNLSTSQLLKNQDKLYPANLSQIEIYIQDISSNPVREATIIVKSSDIPESQARYLFTNRNGTSIAQINSGTYDFSIQARNYKNESKTITVFNESPGIIEFTLIPETGYDIWIFFLPIYLGFLLYVCWLCESSEKMKLTFILFLLSIFIPFLCLMSEWSHTMFFYVSLFFLIFLTIIFLLLYLYSSKTLPFAYKWEDCSNTISKIFRLLKALLTVLTILSWSLISCYFACEGIEVVVISDISFLQFPSYIVIGVTIGVLSYIMLTIKQIFIQLLPEHKKKSLIWECTRRIIIAPYIAIMGIYLIFYLIPGELTDVFGNNIKPDAHFVFLFSIFAGMFTSTIEEWIYNKFRDILSLNKDKLNENNKYDIEMSDFTKLGMSEDLIYRLYYEANIANMQNLANSDAKNVSDKLKAQYSEKEIQQYVDLAKRDLEGARNIIGS